MSRIDEEDIRDRIISATSHWPVAEQHALLSQFQCRCLNLLDPPLTEPLSGELRLAQLHWFGDQSLSDELIAANERCWGYFAEYALANSPIEDEYRVRLVIGLLVPQVRSRGESIESLEWFLEYINLLGDYTVMIESMVKNLETTSMT